MRRMPLLTVTTLCCVMALTACATKVKPYERLVQAAYDDKGQIRDGYATLNLEYLEALSDDLEACYARKKP